LIRFRPDKELEARFLAYFLQSPRYWQAIRERAAGIALQNVNAKKLASIFVPIAPGTEQRRIVAEVEKQFTRLDAAVSALKRVQANLRRYRAAVLKVACEGRLVPTEAELARKDGSSYETGEQLLARILKERRAKWEADQLAKMQASGKAPKDDSWTSEYKDPAPPDTSNLPLLPEGWTWASLGQTSWSVRDGPHYSPKYTDEGIPFVTGGQVRPPNTSALRFMLS
jgi:type I restriction enzyme S subunit